MTTESATPLGEEVAIGGTPAGRSANAALRCFSKAARAFTLYDPQNEAVRRFLQEYRDAVAAFLAAHGALDLEVRQFELAYKGEVVHSEKDREKSLAYRLFRDGIRRLTIEPGASWDEQLKLLEILSVRFIGVRQQEEDVVTLLTRAAFKSIEFTAATGLVAAEKDEDAPVRKKAAAGAFPPDFDGPAPPLYPPRLMGCFPIPKLALEQFEAEESAETLPGNAVRMVRELLDDANQEELKTLVPAVEEVRDFLLAELEVKHLRDLAKVVAGQHGNAGAVLGPSLKPLAAPYTLQKLLATVPAGEEPPDALVELLDMLARYGADLLDPLLDRIASAGVDPALRTLAKRAAQGKKEKILERLSTSEPPLTGLLLEFLEPGAQQEAAKQLLASEHAGAQLSAVKMFEEPYAPAQLVEALQSQHAEVRLAAAEALARHKEKKAFEPIRDLVISLEAVGLEQNEAEALGTALGAIDAKGAFEIFESWLHPPQSGGLLSKLVGKKPKRMLLWTAATGLIQVPGEPTLALLREIGAIAADDEELKKQSLKCIAFWRRRGAQPNG
ncbi:MAG: hypothetical protein ABR567_12850 [Myxococcales bacterium]|nr:hypothetical protein [Myxococcales bacterium]